MPICKRGGFTLLELSIVVLIIGLLAGGIVAGRDLIRAAEMHSVHRGSQQFVAAAYTFRVKYRCLPGDCDTLEEFFGSDPNGCPPPSDSPPSRAACNGNGSGILERTEQLEAWRNLAAAGLIAGTFSGTPTGNPPPPTLWMGLRANYNCPILLSERFCWVWNNNTDEIDGVQITVPGRDYGKTLLAMVPSRLETYFAWQFPGFIGTAYAFGSAQTNIWVFTSAEAQSYDSKYDDGNPVTGAVMGEILPDDFGALCVVESSPGEYRYDLGHAEQTCGFFYRSGF